jgi:hypothetical protein
MKRTFITATLLLLAACATPLPRTDVDPAANFSRLHSYAWLAEDPLFQPGDGDRAVSLLNRRRVVEAIESTLAARGFTRASTRESADFTIVYSVGTRERVSGSSFGDSLYRPWFWGWPYYGRDMGLEVRSDIEGRLAIDILDAGSKKPIWHGVSAEALGALDLDQSGIRLVRAAQTVLAQFPPH